MPEKTLYALVEPDYASSVWFMKSLAGLRHAAARRKVAIRLSGSARELEELLDLRTFVLIASDSEWTSFLVSQMRERGVRAVLMGPTPNDFGPDVSGALINREALVGDMVRYFCSCGRTRLASLGYEANLVNDGVRRHAFVSAAREYRLAVEETRDVYDLNGSLDHCISRFFENVSLYDGVLCTNDYIACRLIAEAGERGVRVPEELFVAGSGNLLVGSCASPTLTTSTLDYYEMGVQTLGLWSLIEENANVVSAGVTIPYKIIPRGSTAFLPIPGNATPQSLPAPSYGMARDASLMWLRRLEACLMRCDALDFALIAGVLGEKSTQELAEKCFISPGTVQYRLRKLYAAVDASDRAEFARRLKPYIANLEALQKEKSPPRS
ncbi:MAG TPA: substrate-binding domain-containing protein [Clostridia bacterium]|nr:substrate-binding domain-containing protein [Clostridia bacterium]